jgi:hypothetical protein
VTVSALILRGVASAERGLDGRRGGAAAASFWLDLKAGVRFVARHRPARRARARGRRAGRRATRRRSSCQILFATRTLGLSEHAVGLATRGWGSAP